MNTAWKTDCSEVLATNASGQCGSRDTPGGWGNFSLRHFFSPCFIHAMQSTFTEWPITTLFINTWSGNGQRVFNKNNKNINLNFFFKILTAKLHMTICYNAIKLLTKVKYITSHNNTWNLNTEGAANVTICTGILERKKQTDIFLNNGDIFLPLFKSIVYKLFPSELVFLTNHARQKINALALLHVIF